MKSLILTYLLGLLQEFIKPLKSKALIWLSKWEVYRHVVLVLIPNLRISTKYTKMRGWKYHDGYEKLQPGDIVLASDHKKISTHIIGGDWAHAGLCISKDTVFECAEMTSKHYTKSTFADMCFEADRVCIIRCKDFDPDYIQKVIEKCLSFEGAEYDVAFTLKNDFLYCSELIYESDFERRLKVDLEDLALIGNPYLSPTGLYLAENVEIIWDSEESYKD